MASTPLDRIQQPILTQMGIFEEKFKDSMRSQVPLLDKITQYIVRRKGKQMRPMFVFLSAELLGGTTESTYRAASLIELLHTATLVHDDVVDDSMERRGFFSVNALWKNKIAVLVGDYLLSQGLLLSVDHEEHGLLRIVSNAVREMSEGELLQMEKARRLDIREPVYFDIIRQKTASLIASCCACGAFSTGASTEQVEQMRRFGELTGIAFQLKDDLFDYGTGDVGKPTGNDIKEKKMTLPLIFALQKATDRERRDMIRTVQHNHNDPSAVDEVMALVTHYGGIEYATQRMLQYRDEALEILQHFNPCPARDSLRELVVYTTERTK